MDEIIRHERPPVDTPPVLNTNSVADSPSARWVWGLLVVLILTAVVRWHRMELPLERDEGEYAYAGQLMLEGMPPYVGAYNMKLPGIYLAYTAILGVFGQTVWAIHLGLLLINLASICLVYLIGRKLIDARGALFSAATFAVLSCACVGHRVVREFGTLCCVTNAGRRAAALNGD